MKLKSKTELVDEVSKKEAQIRDLQSIIDNAIIKKELELAKAMNGLEKERDQLINDLKNKDTEKELLEKSLNEQFKNKLENKDEALKLKDDTNNSAIIFMFCNPNGSGQFSHTRQSSRAT